MWFLMSQISTAPMENSLSLYLSCLLTTFKSSSLTDPSSLYPYPAPLDGHGQPTGPAGTGCGIHLPSSGGGGAVGIMPDGVYIYFAIGMVAFSVGYAYVTLNSNR